MSVTEVIYSHLNFRLQGETGRDICANFSPDVVILSSFGRFYGHEGVQESARILADEISGGTFSYRQTLVEENYGFLEWTATTAEAKVRDGADSFVISDGLIVLQTIHYTVLPHDGD